MGIVIRILLLGLTVTFLSAMSDFFGLTAINKNIVAVATLGNFELQEVCGVTILGWSMILHVSFLMLFAWIAYPVSSV